MHHTHKLPELPEYELREIKLLIRFSQRVWKFVRNMYLFNIIHIYSKHVISLLRYLKLTYISPT